jgi:hypothetical protein
VETPNSDRIEDKSNPTRVRRPASKIEAIPPVRALLRLLAVTSEQSMDLTVQLLDLFEDDPDLEPDADVEPGGDDEPNLGWLTPRP